MEGTCPKCDKLKKLTKHHILPRCHFKGGSGKIVYLCRVCHDEIEKFIEQVEGKKPNGKRKKLSYWQYPIIYQSFLMGDTDVAKLM